MSAITPGLNLSVPFTVFIAFNSNFNFKSSVKILMREKLKMPNMNKGSRLSSQNCFSVLPEQVIDPVVDSREQEPRKIEVPPIKFKVDWVQTRT